MKAHSDIHFQIGQLGWKRFAIKDDYLKFVEAMGGLSLAVATTAAVPATEPVVTAVTLLFGGLALADRLASKSASLTPDQYRLLLTLKARGPISAETLGVYLSGLHIAGSDFWTEERTTKALNVLQNMRLGDGTVEPLVVMTPDGRLVPVVRSRHRPSPCYERLGSPDCPAIRFTQGRLFGASLGRFCCGLSGCSPPVQI
jgi:hypothetical protein